MLHPKIAEELRELRDKMEADGKLLSQSQLDTYYRAFRQQFGPERLSNLDGTKLLNTMFDSSNHDSMVYWLEFKNDAEFPSPRFGSIAGGSALKFGLYRRNATGEWMTGSPAKQEVLTEQQAVRMAHERRNQLLASCDLLEQLPIYGDNRITNTYNKS